jgi:Terminase large subunit, T4likevirus-type, N-terminal
MSTPTMPEFLAEKFPALAKYCPNLATISTPQALFLLADQREVFYGGAAGGGKSDALLMAALQYVDVPGYAALLLRRTYAELEKADGLIPRAQEWLAGSDARKLDGGRKWVFPSGARLEFGHVESESDRFRYQSAAYQFIGFDELTSFPESVYDYIGFSRSRRRRMGRVAKVPIRVRSASNPGNVGHGWVKARFVDERRRKRGVVFIPARVADNPGLDVTEYRDTMAHLSEELQSQLLEGNWDVFEGAAFPQFGEPHLVDSFPLDGWARIEGADYGLNGTAWLLLCSDFDGNLVFADSIAERELLPDEVCRVVLAHRAAGWGSSHLAYMDPSVWHRIGARDRWGAPAMLADEFRNNGVPLQPANNDPRAGLARLRMLMTPDPQHRFPQWHTRAGEYGAPRLFVVGRRCGSLVEQLKAAPLQPLDKRDGGEIVDPMWESRTGHFVAAARYGCLAPLSASEPEEQWEPDPRKRQIMAALKAQNDTYQNSRWRPDYSSHMG